MRQNAFAVGLGGPGEAFSAPQTSSWIWKMIGKGGWKGLGGRNGTEGEGKEGGLGIELGRLRHWL